MDGTTIDPSPSTDATRDGWLRSPWLFAVTALALLVLLFGRSMMRPFDMDEHQFVAPGVFLSNQGVLPYLDYPYFHMPHLVYVHAAATAWMPYKLLVTRTISVLCGWTIVLLLARAGWTALEGQAARLRWAIVGGVLAAYVCSQLFAYTNGLSWNHDSATLCALGALLLQLRGMRKGQYWPIALAGALAGLTMGIRLSFALIVIPMALGLVLGRSPFTWPRRGVALGLATAAALLVLTPAFIPWLLDPEAFVFGNIGYTRLNERSFGRTGDLGGSFAKLSGFARKFFADPGNALILLLGMHGLALIFWNRRARRSRFANELGLLVGFFPVLLIGAWGPTPVQQQYYYMLLPFLTLAGLYALALQCSEPSRLLGWRRVVVWAALVTVVVGLPRWYWQVIYLPCVSDWTPMRVHRTAEWIRSNCPPQARVMTADPVFPLEAGLEAYPEYATGRFVFYVGDIMTQPDRRRLRMTWGEELERVLAERPPDAVFMHTRANTQLLTEFARNHGFRKLDYGFSYRDVFSDGETFELWVRTAEK